jgi:hypothetical protein
MELPMKKRKVMEAIRRMMRREFFLLRNIFLAIREKISAP